MARRNRCEVFNPSCVSIVHCLNRAVRRAMLCGNCPYTGKSYEHRRNWIKTRLQFLAQYYAIDILAYSIMGNHFHLILRNRPDIVRTWSDREVARRIWNLFPRRRNQDGTPAEPTEAELEVLANEPDKLEKYRLRLSDVSWLMRQLAENIARRSNKEDECTGRFWEGRFKCQPLLDDQALLACAAYVDLNPVRAAIADTPETSDFTSIQDRIASATKIKSESCRTESKSVKKTKSEGSSSSEQRDQWLAPVQLSDFKSQTKPKSSNGLRASDKGFLKISLETYFQLVDWTGRRIVKGKKGSIPETCRPILERLGFEEGSWVEFVSNFGRLFKRVVGSPDSIEQASQKRNRSRYRASGGAALLG